VTVGASVVGATVVGVAVGDGDGVGVTVGGAVVGGAVVAGGVVAAVVAVAAGAAVVGAVVTGSDDGCGPTLAGVVRAERRLWDVVAAALGVPGSDVVVAGSESVPAGVVGASWDGVTVQTSPRGAWFAVRAGGSEAGVPPAVTNATPSPDPEMITAVAMRKAARRPGSSRRCDRITASSQGCSALLLAARLAVDR
jgi:hypothetical protein